MITHEIVTKGKFQEAILHTIKTTNKLIEERLIETPLLTCNASMYYKDVSFLLDIIKNGTTDG